MVIYASYGRGGAGNMADSQLMDPCFTSENQVLPVLKTSYVTTGRGGSGNMARNTDPVETRMRQDVIEPVRPPLDQVYAHGGRGGAGNVYKMSHLCQDASPISDGRTPSLDSIPRRRSTEIVHRAINFFRK